DARGLPVVLFSDALRAPTLVAPFRSGRCSCLRVHVDQIVGLRCLYGRLCLEPDLDAALARISSRGCDGFWPAGSGLGRRICAGTIIFQLRASTRILEL